MVKLPMNHFKRVISSVLACAMSATILPYFPVNAEETVEKYPYTMFAASDNEGAITVNAGNFCVNGNIATNGTIVSSGNMNINGTKTEQANEEMVYVFNKIDVQYFSSSNVEAYAEDYTLEEMNINITNPLEVEGDATLTGNININTALKAMENVELYGEVKNTNDSLIFSQYGDIIIESQNVNLNGLIYAPFGDVEITAQNLNLNNVVIIADTITLDCPSVNANYNSNVAEFVGTESEQNPIINVDKSNMVYNAEDDVYYTTVEFKKLNGFLGKSQDMISFNIEIYDIMETLIFSAPITPSLQWELSEIGLMCGINRLVLTAEEQNGEIHKYELKLLINRSEFVDNLQLDLSDNDGDGLWNYIENYFGTNIEEPDTDNDGLSDLMEIYTLGYNPLNSDTDDDSILDGEEDEDQDGLTNLFEINEFKSGPIFFDTDHDGLTDEEEYQFRTSPLMKDTDEDGISDYDEYYIFGTDPIVTNPSDMKYTKEFTIDDIEGSYDAGLYPTLSFTGDAEGVMTFQMSEVEQTPLINHSMVGFIGSAYEFETKGEMDSATLTFTYDPDLLFIDDLGEEKFLPTIYYFNEETCDLEEVANQVWEDNQVTAELEHFSIYLLLNKKEVELFWNSEWLFPETDEVERAPEKQIVFLLDRSGSMDWNDSNYIRAELVKEFSSQLNSSDKIKIYGFDDHVIDFTPSGFIHFKDNINTAVNNFVNAQNGGGTMVAYALSCVYSDLLNEKEYFETLKKLSGDTDATLEQYVFLLTDGESSDTPSAEFLKNVADDGIKIYTVGLGDANSYYLRAIADATGGKSYMASSVSNLDEIYLQFSGDIESGDENQDGIEDYYEYMMCQGLLTTRTGTTVFEGVEFDELMSSSDYDGDLLTNGQEITVSLFGGKPYVTISSDPTRQYTDKDQYSDYEEFNNGTNPLKVSYVITKDDYFDVYDGGGYVYTEEAYNYISQSSGTLAFKYFIDVVFCGSENYFDVIIQGAQSFIKWDDVCSENLLVKQDEKLLVEYLSANLELSEEQNVYESTIDTLNNYIDGMSNWIETLEDLYKDEINAGIDKVRAEKLAEEITKERTSISELQSYTAQLRNAGNMTPTLRAKYDANMAEIASRQSALDHNRFSEIKTQEFNERLQKFSDRYKSVTNVISFVQLGYSRMSQLTELVKYSSQLAAFVQYKEFLTELSCCDFEYAAEAASSILKDIELQEENNYFGKGTLEFLHGAVNDAVDEGIDVAIEKFGSTASSVFVVAKLLVGTFVGENLSIERENLLNADLYTQIISITTNEVSEICGLAKNNGQIYVCEGSKDCLETSESFVYAIMARKVGEEKYLELSQKRTGLIGLFGYNPLDHSDATLVKLENNIELMNTFLIKYRQLFGDL